jgi:hypothetical protein
MKYKASIGGHAPGHLRDAFLEYLEKRWWQEPTDETVNVGGEEKPLRWLLEQLWNCTDFLSRLDADMIDVDGISTFGIAAREIACQLDPPFVPSLADPYHEGYLLQCGGCGSWNYYVEHEYRVTHGPYWTEYTEHGDLDHRYLDDIVVGKWTDNKVTDSGCEDWDVDDEELEWILDRRDVEIAERGDKRYLVCGTCRERFEIDWYQPSGGYLCDEIHYGDAEDCGNGVIRVY